MNPEFSEQLALLPDLLAGHLLLTIAALTAGILISLPLGIAAARSPRVSRFVLGLAGLIQTVPSIALLALMVPLLAGTIGFLPAFIALSLYSILPILRNTVTGLAGIDSRYVDAARAVGMTGMQRLLQVELPLAFPVIIAGIRTSAVWVVGTATLSTPVGAQSLGNYIFAGLQTRNLTAVLFGCVFAAALAILLDQLLGLFERSANTRNSGGMLVAAMGLVSIFTAGLSPVIVDAVQNENAADPFVAASIANTHSEQTDTPGSLLAGQRIVVGSKGFTEQYILSSLLSRHLQALGAEVDVTQNMGTTILFDALRNDSVDIYVEYTGTVWAAILKKEQFPPRRRMQIEIEHRLLQDFQILSLGRIGFENAYGLAMRREHADALGIRSIADLSRFAPSLNFAGDPEFFSRAEWQDVRDAYDLDTGSQRTMDSTFMYEAVRDANVDVISAYTTDGRLDAYDLVVLDDPLRAFPPYDSIMLISPAAQRKSGLVQALEPLVNGISQAEMREANRRVDIDGASPARSAEILYRTIRAQ